MVKLNQQFVFWYFTFRIELLHSLELNGVALWSLTVLIGQASRCFHTDKLLDQREFLDCLNQLHQLERSAKLETPITYKYLKNKSSVKFTKQLPMNTLSSKYHQILQCASKQVTFPFYIIVFVSLTYFFSR